MLAAFCRAQQRRLNVILVEEMEQIIRRRQAIVVIDDKFLAVKLGAAVNERRNAARDQIAAEVVIIQDAPGLELVDRRRRASRRPPIAAASRERPSYPARCRWWPTSWIFPAFPVKFAGRSKHGSA
jgi:hypothetical protein